MSPASRIPRTLAGAIDNENERFILFLEIASSLRFMYNSPELLEQMFESFPKRSEIPRLCPSAFLRDFHVVSVGVNPIITGKIVPELIVRVIRERCGKISLKPALDFYNFTLTIVVKVDTGPTPVETTFHQFEFDACLPLILPRH